jgi:hypothetical protein
MKARAAFAAMFLITSIATASATVRIYDDTGGQIGDYLAKFRALRLSGQRVEIDGTCASACTILLGTIPHNRICVTPRAVLEFHSAWDPTPSGGEVASRAGNQFLSQPSAQVDQSPRRIEFSHHQAERRRLSLDVSCLPALSGRRDDYSPLTAGHRMDVAQAAL